MVSFRQILRLYLENQTFQVFTNHQPLNWLLVVTDVSGRLARWRLCLSEFNFSIEYKTGHKQSSGRCHERLCTTGQTNLLPDLKLPALSADTAFPQESFTIHFMDYNINEIIDEEDTNDILLINSSPIDLTFSEKTDLTTALSTEEIVREHSKDDYCMKLQSKLYKTDSILFSIDDRGQLIRVYPRD